MTLFDWTALRTPFYDEPHRALASKLEGWVQRNAGVPETWAGQDIRAVVRQVAAQLGRDGWLEYGVLNNRAGSSSSDWRSICLIREALAFCHDLYDYVFSIQSLAAHGIAAYGSEAQRADYLPVVVSGERLGCLALSEPQSGSDLAAIRLTASHRGAEYRLNGEKVWIANANVADFYCVLARTADGPPAFSMTLFLVQAGDPGVSPGRAVELLAPRPISGLRFDDCRVPEGSVLGKPGHGLRLALEILERYRITVAATAIGFCRRALREALTWSKTRHTASGLLIDQQMTRERLADMAVYLDAASLLVARAAWEVDAGKLDALSKHSSAAKVYATEGAQEVIDRALQLFGAAGLESGSVTEGLYRQIRALRIYEGTSEIQKLIIAGTLR